MCTKLHEQLLAADMAAFKAANPGCVFEDFTAWRRPEELREYARLVRGSTLALQERAEWEAMWAATAPAAVDGRDARRTLEGQAERALHWLETVAPVVVFRQLLAVAVDAHVRLMQHSGGQFPSVCAVLDRYVVGSFN